MTTAIITRASRVSESTPNRNRILIFVHERTRHEGGNKSDSNTGEQLVLLLSKLSKLSKLILSKSQATPT